MAAHGGEEETSDLLAENQKKLVMNFTIYIKFFSRVGDFVYSC